MPAPKNPNTANAVLTNRRRKHDRWAAEMRAEEWLVIAPEKMKELLDGMSDERLGFYIRNYYS